MTAAIRAKAISKHLAEQGVRATVDTETDQSVSVLLHDACPTTNQAVRDWCDRYSRVFIMTTYNAAIRAAAAEYQQAHPEALMHDILTQPGAFWNARKPRIRAAA